MRISVTRSGGFTGIPIQFSFDEQDLDPQETQELLAALQESRFFNLPTHLSAQPGSPDTFSYTITVETSDQLHTVFCHESALPDSLDAIVRKLARRARRTS
ncbi:MAG TPA: protealysin inhibitor emfourin [Levilinea sp.]|nr:protealysin inhibitor emfourin [Levilinea sp.]